MPEISHLNLSDSGLVFDSRSGDSFQINDSAAIIIRLMQEAKTTEAIVEKLKQIYNLSHEQAVSDVLEFKLHLSIIGLIK